MIPEVDRLLVQLDRKTQEVEIEARVVAASRTFARDIGTQLGFGWGNGPSALGGAPLPATNNIINTVSKPALLHAGWHDPVVLELGGAWTDEQPGVL